MKKAGSIIMSSPHVRDGSSTPKIMWEVVISLIPLVVWSSYLFGIGAILVTLSATLGCVVTEWMVSGKKKLEDGSGLITGILLGLCLPPGFAMWMAFVGGVVAIGIGKLIWGGLGQNVFNPALVGRAFLQAAFPTAITTWHAPKPLENWFTVNGANLAFPFLNTEITDAFTGATPLTKMKFDHDFGHLPDQFMGLTSGSIGETSSLIILILGVWLILRKIIHWRIPAGTLLTVTLLSGVFWQIDPTIYPSPGFMLCTGGLMLGTFYMATDLVTSPITPKGQWFYAIGIGVLVVMIRLWGGLPEGVMYAILMMNAATPLINRGTKIKPYGYK
jgi:electron transport complex protein RnfD